LPDSICQSGVFTVFGLAVHFPAQKLQAATTLSGKKAAVRWLWILFWMLWLLFQYPRIRKGAVIVQFFLFMHR
jgi:hypothetical protein